ncbi:hypothetical protein [Nakamurella antarctica]|uniref:hypothetical protein n=1 Tax=Nakamurella antarctica TaxID=1902245 RepID=UPI0013DE682A|nr:hypothetical protein [Nakamurella antarctica]
MSTTSSCPVLARRICSFERVAVAGAVVCTGLRAISAGVRQPETAAAVDGFAMAAVVA